MKTVTASMTRPIRVVILRPILVESSADGMAKMSTENTLTRSGPEMLEGVMCRCLIA